MITKAERQVDDERKVGVDREYAPKVAAQMTVMVIDMTNSPGQKRQKFVKSIVWGLEFLKLVVQLLHKDREAPSMVKFAGDGILVIADTELATHRQALAAQLDGGHRVEYPVQQLLPRPQRPRRYTVAAQRACVLGSGGGEPVPAARRRIEIAAAETAAATSAGGHSPGGHSPGGVCRHRPNRHGVTRAHTTVPVSSLTEGF
jgi:hypothetical protein